MPLSEDTKKIIIPIVVFVITAAAGFALTVSVKGGADVERDKAVEDRLSKLETLTKGLPDVYTIIPTTFELKQRVTNIESDAKAQRDRLQDQITAVRDKVTEIKAKQDMSAYQVKPLLQQK